MLEGSTIPLLWTFCGAFATSISAAYASPRRGRQVMSLVCFGLFVIQCFDLLRYQQCSWNFLACDKLTALPSVSNGTVTFDRAYRFVSLFLLYLLVSYAIAFKQHLAWPLLFLLLAHYNTFAFITGTVLYVGGFASAAANFVAALCAVLLLSAAELLNRAGRSRAQVCLV